MDVLPHRAGGGSPPLRRMPASAFVARGARQWAGLLPPGLSGTVRLGRVRQAGKAKSLPAFFLNMRHRMGAAAKNHAVFDKKKLWVRVSNKYGPKSKFTDSGILARVGAGGLSVSIWKRLLATACIAAAVDGFLLSAGQANDPQVTKKSAEIGTILDDATSKLSGVRLEDPKAFDEQKLYNLVNAGLSLKAQEDNTSLDIVQAKLSLTLLGDLSKTASQWPMSFASVLETQANTLDDWLVTRDKQTAFSRLSTKLRPLITDMPSAPENVRKIAVGLREELAKHFPPPAKQEPVETDVQKATRAAGELDGLLKDETKKAVLRGNKDVSPKLSALREALVDFAADNQERVHIVGALYGDVNAIVRVLGGRKAISNNLDRVCIATSTALKYCQRSTNCNVAEQNFRKNVCGFDPAPFLDNKYMALQIWYFCAKNKDEYRWRDHLGSDTYKFDPDISRSGDFQTAVLYNSSQSFACQDKDRG